MTDRERARRPEDLTRLFVERANAKDAEGIALLYEEEAVLAYPPGQQTLGRAAIHKLWEETLPHLPTLEPDVPLPTLTSGELALTSASSRAGARAQVVRRQGDGTWLRVLDQPALSAPAP